MFSAEKKLLDQLNKRKQGELLRTLSLTSDSSIDFYSNDYLGFSKLETKNTNLITRSGSTGSRLLSGNYPDIESLEKKISNFHHSESSLLFNSGYDANLGLLSCVPQREDLIFYDELVHASIIDGLMLSHAKSVKFRHNDLNDLINKIERQNTHDKTIYIVVESVYSMDGDIAPLKELNFICLEKGYHLIVDEAHAGGIYGQNGEGMCYQENIHHSCFARIITYGKAFGVHGASICGSEILKQFLINFSRPFIYTTALPQHTVLSIFEKYENMIGIGNSEREKLFNNITKFSKIFSGLKGYQFNNRSPIQTIIIPGNIEVNNVSTHIKSCGFEIRPIKSPTVKAGTERLRICLHSFNTNEEINNLFLVLSEKLN
ncbi:MAG: aminotransferase class I/II-fold pyridoxal phosphate-dependent enzyme [Bacteroidota bacterium]|jgi:8-amino-7-oxononanoate synthase